MKKILLLLLMLCLILPAKTYALTTTPSATGSADDESTMSDQINNLKERIASKVAELKLVDKKGTAGIVDNTLDTSLQMTTSTGKTLFVDVDEITKFASGSAKDIGISDFTKGTKLSVLGLYNKQSKRILARYISVITLPSYISGTVQDVDTEDFTVTVLSKDKKSTIVDVENTTRTSQYAAGLTSRAGFSRITPGQYVAVSGYPAKTDPSRISATRILVFPEIGTGTQNATPSAASPTRTTR